MLYMLEFNRQPLGVLQPLIEKDLAKLCYYFGIFGLPFYSIGMGLVFIQSVNHYLACYKHQIVATLRLRLTSISSSNSQILITNATFEFAKGTTQVYWQC